MYKRRQRCRQRSRRRPKLGGKHTGNISEASESSIDEAKLDLNQLMQLKGQHSDSDDLLMTTQRMPSFHNHSMMSLAAESDSVTENLSPNRHHRRRKRGKRMAVDRLDQEPDKGHMDLPDFAQTVKQAKNSQGKKNEVMEIGAHFQRDCEGMLPGKRKRTDGGHADSCDAASHDNYDGAGTSHMDCGFRWVIFALHISIV